MRLLNTESLQLEEVVSCTDRSYAILSHTWAEDEVSLHEMRDPTPATMLKAGFKKVASFCEVALQHGFEYVWIDTCCIDKKNSTELSEAINSMYKYYQNAVCFIYLADVLHHESKKTELGDLRRSAWLTRGWTLQELLANPRRRYLARDWAETSWGCDRILSQLTGIRLEVLDDPSLLASICVAERISWASRRTTTRPEDLAYCLLGIFDVSMPILYGEGLKKAFRRLQKEILEMRSDDTLFA